MTTNSWLKDAASVSKADSIPELGSYRPSVPLSVYRELVQELKETQSQVAILEQENQRLRQQIEEIVSVKPQLQQVMDTLAAINSIKPKIGINSKLSVTNEQINSSLIETFNRTKKESLSFFQTQDYRVNVPSKKSLSSLKDDRKINGWILAVAIVLIVLTSCTGAFLIINFRLSHSNR